MADIGSLGQELRGLRVAAGLSQRQLGRRIERCHSVISRWESGILEPTVVDLSRLTRVIGGSLDRLIAAEGPGRRWSSRSHSLRERRQVGLALMRARHMAGIRLAAAVRVTGMPGRRIERIEAGADPSLAELRALLALTGADSRQLLRPERPRVNAERSGLDRIPNPTRLALKQWSARRFAGSGASRIGVQGAAPGQESSGQAHNFRVMAAVLGPLAA